MRIKINASSLLVLLALLFVLLTWYVIVFNYRSLPETIPVHFNYKGEVDGYGSKSSIIMLPIISTILFAFINVKTYPVIFTARRDDILTDGKKNKATLASTLAIFQPIITSLFLIIALSVIYDKHLINWVYLPIALLVIMVFRALIIPPIPKQR